MCGWGGEGGGGNTSPPPTVACARGDRARSCCIAPTSGSYPTGPAGLLTRLMLPATTGWSSLTRTSSQWP